MEEGDIQGAWDGHVHIAVFKTDNQQGPAVEHKESAQCYVSAWRGGSLGDNQVSSVQLLSRV